MSTDTKTMGLDSNLETDTQAIIAHLVTGQPLDPTILQRIRARSERIRQQALAMHGVQDIGVPIIREIRGERMDS